jgi:hypothetical protein
VTASRRHQVTDIGPPPEPKVTQYVAQAKECPCCGTVTEGELLAHVRARASYGPEACAQAANLTCGHYIPVHRATSCRHPGQAGRQSLPQARPVAPQRDAALRRQLHGPHGRPAQARRRHPRPRRHPHHRNRLPPRPGSHRHDQDLHAIQWQHFHSSPSVQVTVPERPHESPGIQAGCCTFVLTVPSLHRYKLSEPAPGRRTLGIAPDCICRLSEIAVTNGRGAR